MNRKFLALSGIVALVLLAAAWASPWSSNKAGATDWAPFFGPADVYRLDPPAPGANADTHSNFNVLAPSANFTALFGGAITFGDSDVFTASHAQIPGTGAYVGQLDSVATLGLINSGCNNDIGVTFNFVDSNVILTPPGSALAMTPNVTLTNAINDTQTSFTYTSAGDPIGPPLLNPGAVKAEIEIDNEQILITAINQGTNTYGDPANATKMIRGWNGTLAAAHGAGAQVRRVNVIFPSGPNTNLLGNLAQDDGDLDNNGTVEHPSLVNDVADGADAIPSFMRDQADPNGTADDGGYVQPHARYAGVAFVANTLIVVLQFVVWAPGQLAQFPNLQWATAAWGYGNTTILQDPVAPPSTSNITDFCNFSSQTDFYGVPHDNLCTDVVAPPITCQTVGAGFTVRLAVDNGCPAFSNTNPNECGLAGQVNGICPATTCPRSTNPATAQRVKYYQYSVSQRDYDNDGIENGLDSCAYIVNPSWNARAPNGPTNFDADSDGIPEDDPAPVCDPGQNPGDSDQDNDAWVNRLDQCPLNADSDVANGNGGGLEPNTFQFDQDHRLGAPFPPGQTNNNVPDGGPRSDSISPTCDIAANNCAGCPGSLDPNGANGHYHATAASGTICIGAVTTECSLTADDDGDGVVNHTDTCRGGANPPSLYPDGPAVNDPGRDDLSAAPEAGASFIRVGASEADTLGFTEGAAIVIGVGLGTRETLRYITSLNIDPVTLLADPGRINFNDLTTSVGTTYTQGLTNGHGAGEIVAQVRFSQSLRDLNNSGFSDTGDTASLTSVFGSQGGVPQNDGVGDSGIPGYQGRLDNSGPVAGVPDSFVDTSDIAQFTSIFGAAC